MHGFVSAVYESKEVKCCNSLRKDDDMVVVGMVEHQQWRQRDDEDDEAYQHLQDGNQKPMASFSPF